VTVGATALIFPESPLWWLYAVLLVGGFSRSLFFTGVNALAYADIDDRTVGQATAFSAVAQQASIAMGVAFAGAILEASIFLNGRDLGVADFHIAFLGVAFAMALGALPFLALNSTSGSQALSGPRNPGDAEPPQ
jgi:hypothetical protein